MFMALGPASLPHIVHRGRWAVFESARRYIQQGPALAIVAARGLPPHLFAEGEGFIAQPNLAFPADSAAP